MSTRELVNEVRAAVAANTTVLVLHESAAEPLTKEAVPQSGSLMLVIGPEGGVADEELVELSDAGAKVIRLGPAVLRTSTAAAVALGAIGVLTGRWG
jgi:16S rRNA (uracil1498-N3)-methyltransferase